MLVTTFGALKNNPDIGDQPVDIEDLVPILSHKRGSEGIFAPYNYLISNAYRKYLKELISQVPIPEKDEGFTKPGPYIYEMLKSLNITHETLPKLIGTVEEAAVLLDEEKQRTATSAGSKLGIIVDMLKLIFRENGSNHADDYRVHVQELEQNSTDVIKGFSKLKE
ncbi:hypothetical protein YC2023_093363 [Brassica napus]